MYDFFEVWFLWNQSQILYIHVTYILPNFDYPMLKPQSLEPLHQMPNLDENHTTFIHQPKLLVNHAYKPNESVPNRKLLDYTPLDFC